MIRTSPAVARRAGRPRRRRLTLLWTLICAVTALSVAATALADARTDYLVRALSTSPMFRVRAQAAISLGSVRTEPLVIEALSGALRDDHPAVRAAAASALERHGDPSVLPALRRLSSDREAAVRSAAERSVAALERVERTQPRTRPVPTSAGTAVGGARFYVAVGRPGTKVRGISRETLETLRGFLVQQAQGVSGVQIAPENERASAANGVIRQGSLTGYYLDSSIIEVEDRPGGGVRARVSVVVQTYPDRNIRSMLSGTATVTAGSGEVVRRQAIEGALRGALRGLPAVLTASAARGP